MLSWGALIIKTENQSAFVRLGKIDTEKVETENGSWVTTFGKRLLVTLQLMGKNIAVKDIIASARLT